MKKKIIPIVAAMLILVVIVCICLFSGKKEVEFDSTKMLTDSKSIGYEIVEGNPENVGIEVTIKNGKPYVTTDMKNQTFNMMFPLLIETVYDREITGFDGKVEEAYQAFMGNGDSKPVLLFLMKDGSVSYLKSSTMLEGGLFEVEGKVNELSDIVKFQAVDAWDIAENGERLGGWRTVVAINKKGYSYDLSKIDYLEETYGF